MLISASSVDEYYAISHKQASHCAFFNSSDSKHPSDTSFTPLLIPASSSFPPQSDSTFCWPMALFCIHSTSPKILNLACPFVSSFYSLQTATSHLRTSQSFFSIWLNKSGVWMCTPSFLAFSSSHPLSWLFDTWSRVTAAPFGQTECVWSSPSQLLARFLRLR